MGFRGRVGLLVLTCALVAPGAASAQLADNPWLARTPLNIAHQGGEIEAPSDTLYAFKTARGRAPT